MEKHYPAFLHGDPGNIGVTFPDFPGCVAAGATFDEALHNAAEALQFHIDGMIEEHLPLPEPSGIAAARAAATACEELPLVCLVTVKIPERTIRINITLPDVVLDEIDTAVRAIPGQNRSAFLATAARDYISHINAR